MLNASYCVQSLSISLYTHNSFKASKRLHGLRWFFACMFFRPTQHCVLDKLEYLQNEETSRWNFIPNHRLRKLGQYGTPTVGECDINSDSGRSVVYSATWRRRQRARCGRRPIAGCWLHSTSSAVCIAWRSIGRAWVRRRRAGPSALAEIRIPRHRHRHPRCQCRCPCRGMRPILVLHTDTGASMWECLSVYRVRQKNGPLYLTARIFKMPQLICVIFLVNLDTVFSEHIC